MGKYSTNITNEARLDVSATGFWIPGQRVFLDVRVFDLNAQRYRGLELNKCFKRNEDEKKKYNEQVLQIENLEPLIHSKVDLNSEKDIFVLTKFVAVGIFTFLFSDIISANRL